MNECEEILDKFISKLKSDFHCFPSEKGITVITPFLYPDHDLIELMIKEYAEGQVLVTDLGETLRNLDSQGFDIKTKKRRFLVKTIAEGVEANLHHGQIVKIGPVEDVGGLMLDVASASRGVADLIYSSRTYEPAVFKEEVSDFLKDHGWKFKMNYTLIGLTEKNYRIDYYLYNIQAGINTMSPRNVGGIKRMVDATFRLWSDVDKKLGKFSLINDQEVRWKEKDYIILGRVSKIVFWGQKDNLQKELEQREKIVLETN